VGLCAGCVITADSGAWERCVHRVTARLRRGSAPGARVARRQHRGGGVKKPFRSCPNGAIMDRMVERIVVERFPTARARWTNM
jgi:hypothetical protein